jgi:tetratricopeptide (TPR) repeat protein
MSAVFTARRLVLEKAANETGLSAKLPSDSQWSKALLTAAACDRLFTPRIELAEIQASPAAARVLARAMVDTDLSGENQILASFTADKNLLQRYVHLYDLEQKLLNNSKQLQKDNIQLLSKLFEGDDPMAVTREKEKVRRRFEEDAKGLKAIGWRRKALGLLHKDGYASPRKALAYYDKAISANPSAAEAYAERGAVETQLKDWGAAYNDYSRAALLDPNMAKAFNNRGLVLERMGQRYDAIKDFDHAIQLDPKFTAAYANRGNAFLALGQYSRALSNYGKALVLAPNDAAVYVNRANAYAQIGRSDLALEDYNQAVKLDQKLAKAYDNRGVLYYRLQKYQEMCRDFSKACDLGLCNNDKAAKAQGLCR